MKAQLKQPLVVQFLVLHHGLPWRLKDWCRTSMPGHWTSPSWTYQTCTSFSSFLPSSSPLKALSLTLPLCLRPTVEEDAWNPNKWKSKVMKSFESVLVSLEFGGDSVVLLWDYERECKCWIWTPWLWDRTGPPHPLCLALGCALWHMHISCTSTYLSLVKALLTKVYFSLSDYFVLYSKVSFSGYHIVKSCFFSLSLSSLHQVIHWFVCVRRGLNLNARSSDLVNWSCAWHAWKRAKSSTVHPIHQKHCVGSKLGHSLLQYSQVPRTFLCRVRSVSTVESTLWKWKWSDRETISLRMACQMTEPNLSFLPVHLG